MATIECHFCERQIDEREANGFDHSRPRNEPTRTRFRHLPQ
jgi:hypothetical protein